MNILLPLLTHKNFNIRAFAKKFHNKKFPLLQGKITTDQKILGDGNNLVIINEICTIKSINISHSNIIILPSVLIKVGSIYIQDCVVYSLGGLPQFYPKVEAMMSNSVFYNV